MKLSRKFKKTIKKRILTTFASIALVTSTLAIVKLTGIPVSEKIDSIINQTKISVYKKLTKNKRGHLNEPNFELTIKPRIPRK